MSPNEEDKPLETLHLAIREIVDQQHQTNERLNTA